VLAIRVQRWPHPCGQSWNSEVKLDLFPVSVCTLPHLKLKSSTGQCEKDPGTVSRINGTSSRRITSLLVIPAFAGMTSQDEAEPKVVPSVSDAVPA